MEINQNSKLKNTCYHKVKYFDFDETNPFYTVSIKKI